MMIDLLTGGHVDGYCIGPGVTCDALGKLTVARHISF